MGSSMVHKMSIFGMSGVRLPETSLWFPGRSHGCDEVRAVMASPVPPPTSLPYLSDALLPRLWSFKAAVVEVYFVGDSSNSLAQRVLVHVPDLDLRLVVLDSCCAFLVTDTELPRIG